jgi:hypothetical protein
MEKNWQGFILNGRITLVYSINPHVLIDVETGVKITFRMVPSYGWEKEYGPPRGGTPPVKTGPGTWLSFFHSWSPHKSRKRRYHWGAYEFRINHAGEVQFIRFTRHPIATASEMDGFSWPVGSCHWEPIVVFPSGAHRHSDGSWTVLAGINDSYCGVFRISADLLDKYFACKSPPGYLV